MKIAVIGAGAIGSLVAGYLKLKGEQISLISHYEGMEAIRKDGLRISGVRGNFTVPFDVFETMAESSDLAILATKSHDLEQAIKDNLSALQSSALLTIQNGVQADNIVARYLPKENIISSIVMFGATSLKPGVVVHNFEQSWIIGKIFSRNDEHTVNISKVLEKAFPTVVTDDIKGMKYLKVFVNANNCIPAILGVSMQEAFRDLEVSGVSMGIWREGLEIINRAGIKLVSLPDFPAERVTQLTAMPALEAARIFSGIMVNLSKEPLYGSILQSIKRGKSSEIDYINGEFLALAKLYKMRAPLNERLVAMVHEVEASGRFFSREELLSNTKEWVFK